MSKYLEAFKNGVKAYAGGKTLPYEINEILNQMNEGSGIDGGLLVPEEVIEEIKILERDGVSLENYVHVEPVKTNEGKLDVLVGNVQPMNEVAEEGLYPEVEFEGEFVDVAYKIKKYGCIKKVSRELLVDAGERFMNVLKIYGAMKSRATRNAKILECIESNFNVEKVSVNDKQGLEKVISEKIGTTLTLGSIILTNQGGYSWIDKFSTSDGQCVKWITVENGVKLFKGLYPIVVMDNRELPSTESKHPLIFGNLKEGILLADREAMSIDFADKIKGYWEKDLIAMKIYDRIDVKQLDDKAIVKCEIVEA